MMLAMRPAALPAEGEGARVIPISDRVLFDRHRRGDPAAFAALVQAFRARVFGYLTRCGVATVDRDDLFQEVFLRVHRAGAAPGESADDHVPTHGALAPWIMTVTVNVVRSHFRKTSVRSIVALDGAQSERAASGDRGPESALAIKQTTAWLEIAIQQLPLEQREALVLCAVEGLELADAAGALGVPEGTVKTRLRRARMALAESRTRLAVRAEREEA
jgi:RNA polymerase sigma-70 factor, ECF subfamily